MTARRIRRPLVSIVAILLLSATLLAGAVPRTSAIGPPVSVGRSIAWISDQQLENGAFPGFDGEADPSTTADVVIAFASAAVDPATITSSTGNDPVSYLTSLAPEAAGSPNAAAKLLLALHAAQGKALDPSDVAGVDLVSALATSYDPASGRYGPGLYVSAVTILALRATGQQVEQGALDTLLTSQIDDGSWNFNGDTTLGAGDSNTTAMVIQALIATGTGTNQIVAALTYLDTLQTADGSIAFDGSEVPLVGDANSTAVAIQAYIAAGRDPSALSNGDMFAALATFQQESGPFSWRKDMPSDNMLATVQAIPALMRKAQPVSHLGLSLPFDGPDAIERALDPAPGLGGEVCIYSIQTFHNACGVYAQYWQANGGLKIFGYPLTEVFIQDGVEMQYFERARFEHHPGAWPENFDILQGRVGAEQLGLGD